MQIARKLAVLLPFLSFACGTNREADDLSCPPGTRVNPERATCAAVHDVRSALAAHPGAGRRRPPNLAVWRAQRRVGPRSALGGPVPGGIGSGITYALGQLQVFDSSSLYTHMSVYPSGVGQLSDYLFTTATNRTEKTLEVVGIYDATGAANIGVFDWSCSTSSPCPDGATSASWQLTQPFSGRPCNYAPQNDGGNHKHLGLYYENSSELVDGVWTNAAYLWNYCDDAWDLIYLHQFTDSQRDCSSDNLCGWWGPILETFQPDPQPDIAELAFWGTTLVHDGVTSDLGPGETGWSAPVSGWSLFHRTANSGYGAGGHVVDLNQAPTVATPASAALDRTTGTTVSLSVLGADDDGEQSLTYTWAVTGPDAVTFTANGTNSSKSTTAAFSKAGTYSAAVSIRDAYGATATSAVAVDVSQQLSAIVVTPGSASVEVGKSQVFVAAARDQFGDAMATPTPFSWAVGGGGTIDGSGTFTATAGGGPFSVTASAGAVTGGAEATVVDDAPTVVVAASATPNPAAGTTTSLSVLGADDGGEAALTYTWASTGPAAVTFSLNGDNAAKSTVATFASPGDYGFSVTIRDAHGGTATSSVSVAVTGGADVTGTSSAAPGVSPGSAGGASAGAGGGRGGGGGGCSSAGAPGLDAIAAATALLTGWRLRRRPRRVGGR